eukprot:1428941-Heterocapsa_arctica.AAC.1
MPRSTVNNKFPSAYAADLFLSAPRFCLFGCQIADIPAALADPPLCATLLSASLNCSAPLSIRKVIELTYHCG